MKRDFLSIADFSKTEVGDLLLSALSLQKKKILTTLRGKTIALIFQKPSTRTMVSFAVGAVQLGGHPLILNADVLQIKRGETPKDTGRVLSRYLDAIVMRAVHHHDLVELGRYATIPVINGLTDQEHPCQVLADLLTIMNHRRMKHPKELQGFRIAYLGDGNNVAQSWLLAAGLLELDLKIASPRGYEPSKEYIDRAQELAAKGKGRIEISNDPIAAVQGADAVYTDVWASMGQEAEIQKRREAFAAFQVNPMILSHAKTNALVMHCLPAHRGEEITEDAIEGPNSVVFDQAENRLHVQKAILLKLLSVKKSS